MSDEVPGSGLKGAHAVPSKLEHAKQIAAELEKELPTVQAAAGKWQTALAGLSGGITIFSIVKSRGDLEGLSSPWPVVAGLLLGFALAMSITGALLSMRAAFGLPKVRDIGTIDIALESHSRAIEAQKLLRAAVSLTLVSAASFAASIAVVWYAPLHESAKTNIVLQGGSVVCGSVGGIEGGRVEMKTPEGVRLVPFTSIAGLSVVAKCPATP